MINVKYKPTLDRYVRANLQIRVLGLIPKPLYYGFLSICMIFLFLLYIAANYLADGSLEIVWTVFLAFIVFFTIGLVMLKEYLLYVKAKKEVKNVEWINLELNDEYFKLTQSNGEKLKYKGSRISKVYESRDFIFLIFAGSKKHLFICKSDLSGSEIKDLRSIGNYVSSPK